MPIEEDRIYRSIFDHALDGLMVIDLETQRVVEANAAACAMYGYLYAELIGMHQAEIVDPQERQANADYLQSVRASGGQEARLVHMQRDGRRFEVEVHSTCFEVRDRLCVLSVIRDVSQRVRKERRLQSGVERRSREQATLLEISQNLASGLELQPGLILDQLREIIEFTHAGLFVLEDGSLQSVALRGPFGLEPGMILQMRCDRPENQAALMNPQQPARIGDIWSEEPAAVEFRSLLGNQSEAVFGEVRSWMWVPLGAKSRTMGVVGVGHTEVDYYSTGDAHLALTVANQAAIVMINAELYECFAVTEVVRHLKWGIDRQSIVQEAVSPLVFPAAMPASTVVFGNCDWWMAYWYGRGLKSRYHCVAR